MSEIWVSLSSLGFSKYEISSYGRIRNMIRGNILNGSKTSDNYVRIKLYNDNGIHQTMIRSNLVARIFCIKPSKNHKTVDHINRIRDDDRSINLRWIICHEDAQTKSKYRVVCQFDINQNLIKLWNSVKKIYKIL